MKTKFLQGQGRKMRIKVIAWLWLMVNFLCYMLIGALLSSRYTALKGPQDPYFKLWAAILITALVLPGFAALAGFLLVAAVFALGGGLVLAALVFAGGGKLTSDILSLGAIWFGFVALPLAGHELRKSLQQSHTIMILTATAWSAIGLGWLMTQIFK